MKIKQGRARVDVRGVNNPMMILNPIKFYSHGDQLYFMCFMIHPNDLLRLKSLKLMAQIKLSTHVKHFLNLLNIITLKLFISLFFYYSFFHFKMVTYFAKKYFIAMAVNECFLNQTFIDSHFDDINS